jgi:DNA polymerase-3 subunit beta
MNIICTKANLFEGVNIVSKAVPNKTAMSILECIFIEAVGQEIKLTANDMEMGIETKIEGIIMKEGKVAIDAKSLVEIVRKLPESDVSISCDENFSTIISCEDSVSNIIGKSGDDFSYLPEIEKIDSVVISQFTLREMIRQTIFSISDRENNKLMTGELFEIEGNYLRVCSLDGHRISIRKVELKNSYPQKKVVIPGKTLNEVSKILSGETDKEVTMYFTDKHVVFEFDETTVVSRLIEGEYFRVDQMLSSDYETKVTVNKKDFFDCIDRTTWLIREDSKKPIVLYITDDKIEIKMNAMAGLQTGKLDINKQGKDLVIGFNPKFMIDALRVIDDETIDIYMVNPKAPCFIRDSGENYIYVILPVNFTVVG